MKLMFHAWILPLFEFFSLDYRDLELIFCSVKKDSRPLSICNYIMLFSPSKEELRKMLKLGKQQSLHKSTIQW